MENIKKLTVFGMELDVVEVSFEPSIEHFNEYVLGDGSVIRVKSVVTSIMRVHEQFMADGSPIYFVFTSPATRVVSSTLRPPVSAPEGSSVEMEAGTTESEPIH